MKIIFAPAKEMKIDKLSTDKPLYSATTQAIIQTLQAQSDDQLKKLYKISDQQVSQVKDYIRHLNAGPAYQALDLYNGLAFRQIDVDDEDSEIASYLDQHFRILSALYGPIKATDPIRPYRLDFNTPLKVNGQNLRHLWGSDFNDFFEKGETVLNLASQEFSGMLDQNRYHWIDFEFYEYDSNKAYGLKKHSTISKKGRGKMVAFLASNQIKNFTDIKKFDADGYQFESNHSNDNKFVFVKRKR
ncbi:peroxide stress protein YaaA [Carnobacterium sp. PL24RED07]|uniref:peroxide stress protein YaaA n=1 Tax=unclassified Carnobacterium TaxID=257487 RepID=UPI0011EDFF92|nr:MULTISPECIES: peroxide stress protein YaaA [unclassified Carnobacterium]KAF3300448.1 peroxide stress protein YaaA [Carnobacterium sp. PL26RED25]KAF3305033.1 peroxide stress protein YaaA [Carnobacterium sp. PL24RED07]